MAFKTKKPVDKTDKAISGFFKGFSGSLRLFGKLRTLIEKNGAPRISVGKTQIAFGEKYKYA